jgi:hypothetical protein
MEVRGCTMPEAVPHGVRALATNLSSQIRFRGAKDSNMIHVLLIYFCQWNERSLAASFSKEIDRNSLSEAEKRSLRMAQTMASMTGLSQGVRLPGPAGKRASRLTVRASAEAETAGRRAVLGLMATAVAGGAFAQVAHAGTVAAIKVGPLPPPSGGLRECLYWLRIHIESSWIHSFASFPRHLIDDGCLLCGSRNG